MSFDSREEAIAYAVKNGKYGSLRLLYSGILSVNHEKHLADVMYSGKLSRISKKHNFREENFYGLLTFATPQISQRKLSCIATKL